jgi:EAL domain-containing protein (putative c-di-GMP-specific phosphodiesterase class I)
VFTRSGEDSYVIVFASLSEDEARLKCALLAREIAEKLHGEHSPTKDIPIRTSVSALSAEVGRDPAKTLAQIAEKPSLIQESGDQGLTVASVQASDDASAADQLSRLLASTEGRLAELDRQGLRSDADRAEWLRIRTRLQRVESEITEIAQTPIWSDVPGYQSGAAWVEMTKLRTMQAVAKANGLRSSLDDGADNPELAFSYRPLWQARRGFVAAYRCSLRTRIGDHEVMNDLPAAEDEEIALANVMDRLVLRRSIKDLVANVNQKRATVIVVPVHYLTLARAGISSGFARLVHAIPRNIRQLLIWEVLDAPVGVWTPQIRPAIAILTRSGRAVFLRVDVDTKDLRELTSLGVHAVGIDVRQSREAEPVLMRKIERFAAQAERARLQCYMDGADSISFANMAIAAGFDYVAGEAIAQTINEPAGIVQTAMYDIYRRHFG